MSLVHPVGSLPAQAVEALTSWMSEQGENPLDGHDVYGVLLWLANKLRPASQTVTTTVKIGAEAAATRQSTGLNSVQKDQIMSSLPKAGEKMNIMDGPLRGLNAVFYQSDGSNRALLLVSMLNQQVKASIAFSSLSSVSDPII